MGGTFVERRVRDHRQDVVAGRMLSVFALSLQCLGPGDEEVLGDLTGYVSQWMSGVLKDTSRMVVSK